MPFKRNIKLMYAMSFIKGMIFYVSIATLYRRECGVSVFQITLIESIALVLSMVLEVPWGILAERLGYKKVLVICSFLSFFSKYIFWAAGNFRHFLLERIVLSFVWAGLSGVDSSILYISCGEENAQKTFGTYTALGSAGLMIASAIFTLLPEGSYRTAAFLTMIAYGIAAVLSLFVTEVRQIPEKPANPFSSLKGAIANLRDARGLLPLLMMNVLFFETLHSITVFFSQLQYQRGGAAMQLLGIATIIGSVCEMGGGFSHRLTGILGEKRFGIITIGLCAIGCIGMAFSANLMISLTAISFMFAACALMGPLTAVMENRMVATDDRATVLSMNSMITGCLTVPLNLILGKMADISLPASFLLCAFLIICHGALFPKSLPHTVK